MPSHTVLGYSCIAERFVHIPLHVLGAGGRSPQVKHPTGQPPAVRGDMPSAQRLLPTQGHHVGMPGTHTHHTITSSLGTNHNYLLSTWQLYLQSVASCYIDSYS